MAWCKFDETQGCRGAGHQARSAPAIGAPKLAEVKALTDVAPWRLAVVLETGDQSARIGLQPGARSGGARAARSAQTGTVPLEGVKWAKPTEADQGKVPTKVSQVLDAGDVVYVEPLPTRTANTACARCRKSPAPWW